MPPWPYLAFFAALFPLGLPLSNLFPSTSSSTPTLNSE
ncbi:hypothetical protein AWRI1631_110560 [Saccharomyces cerevisiae AWRI1631]|uniref:Uncharacterized protein n=1 Tax=Saccharomyces cerevisiae (strain AWRI1631) TaxID=545124 RepID=B5VLZ3_YEAS6|nr:hypothetical protein AWRI1631_110560 [Saccharomyces cerevisiae AWRI1631]